MQSRNKDITWKKKEKEKKSGVTFHSPCYLLSTTPPTLLRLPQHRKLLWRCIMYPNGTEGLVIWAPRRLSYSLAHVHILHGYFSSFMDFSGYKTIIYICGVN